MFGWILKEKKIFNLKTSLENSPISVYTDGACKVHTSKKGSWAFAIVENENVLWEDFNYEMVSTSVRMEILSMIEGLKYCLNNFPERTIIVYSDSDLVKKGIEEWYDKWVADGWVTSQNQPVKHRELWESLKTIIDITDARIEWIPGHSGNRWNEYVDHLTQLAMVTLDPRELLQ